MSKQVPNVTLPFLPPNTIMPSPVDQEDIFIQYFNRLYEDIAYTVNQKDFRFFTIPVPTTATKIPNIPNQGAFIICVCGQENGMPALTASLIKTDSSAAGFSSNIQIQQGTTGVWLGVNLQIGSTATNFTIVTNAVAGTVGNFNIKIIGTA